jgi:hypothetical protein
MRRMRILAGLLALGSLMTAGLGETLALAHVGGALGVLLVVCAAPVVMFAWLALGAPICRQDLQRSRPGQPQEP